ncbi:capsid protein VP1, partial [cosavirus A8]
LGLQSTFSFIVPFISASDFRYNQVAVASALNADGWFSVWLMNPLTYPPGTPPTQQIVLMLSAGDDFSYRLPISPAVAQGPENGPHDNMECGQVDNHDSGMISGHSVGLPTPHTKVDFFYDRYRFIGLVKSVSRNSPKLKSYLNEQKVMNMSKYFYIQQYHPQPEVAIGLTPVPNLNGVPISSFLFAQSTASHKLLPLMKGDFQLYDCCPFTYVKFDLEFTVVPPLSFGSDYTVVWYPPGAPLDTLEMMLGMNASETTGFEDRGENASAAMFTYNPTFYARGPTKVSAVIPFCIPTSLMPLY